MHTFWRTWEGISRKLTSLVSFSENCPGPDNIALMVPDVKASSRLTMNSWPSLEINFTNLNKVTDEIKLIKNCKIDERTCLLKLVLAKMENWVYRNITADLYTISAVQTHQFGLVTFDRLSSKIFLILKITTQGNRKRICADSLFRLQMRKLNFWILKVILNYFKSWSYMASGPSHHHHSNCQIPLPACTQIWHPVRDLSRGSVCL